MTDKKDPKPNVDEKPPKTTRASAQHQDYVVTVRVAHPASTWTTSASFHLIDPKLCTDPTTVNGPVLDRLQNYLNTMLEL